MPLLVCHFWGLIFREHPLSRNFEMFYYLLQNINFIFSEFWCVVISPYTTDKLKISWKLFCSFMFTFITAHDICDSSKKMILVVQSTVVRSFRKPMRPFSEQTRVKKGLAWAFEKPTCPDPRDNRAKLFRIILRQFNTSCLICLRCLPFFWLSFI